MIVALGLLAIAHAQRTGADAPPDDGSSNPLRNGQPAPVRAMDLRTIEPMQVGPVDTDLPPRDNPLRNRRVPSDGSVRPASDEEPQGQGQQGPTRIRLVADGPPTGGNAGSPGSAIRLPAVEPQLMPQAADRYAMPLRAAEDQNALRSPLRPMPLGDRSSGPRLAPLDPGNTYLPGLDPQRRAGRRGRILFGRERHGSTGHEAA